jgi:hypothetical protein
MLTKMESKIKASFTPSGYSCFSDAVVDVGASGAPLAASAFSSSAARLASLSAVTVCSDSPAASAGASRRFRILSKTPILMGWYTRRSSRS